MKISRKALKELITEELNNKNSVLLEQPMIRIPRSAEAQTNPIVGQEQEGDYTKSPDEYGDEVARRSLFHMGAQAQQLHDMIREDVGLQPWVLDEIKKASVALEKVFKALTYDKQNPVGR